jgi:hypothetical protein
MAGPLSPRNDKRQFLFPSSMCLQVVAHLEVNKEASCIMFETKIYSQNNAQKHRVRLMWGASLPSSSSPSSLNAREKEHS